MYRRAVEIADVSKRFGRRVAVDKVTLTLTRGEIVGLVGPNGAGKSTLLRLITGYLVPDTGTVTIEGMRLDREAKKARALIGYVPEDTPLYGALTVDEFLTIVAGLRGHGGRVATAAVERVCERLGLVDERDTLIKHLSRGYRQRTGIAQAMLGDPPILIFDEPTNGLDPQQIVDFRRLLLSLRDEHCVLVSSHLLSEVEKTADRVAYLLYGKLLAVDEVRTSAEGDLEARFVQLTTEV